MDACTLSIALTVIGCAIAKQLDTEQKFLLISLLNQIHNTLLIIASHEELCNVDKHKQNVRSDEEDIE